MGPAWQTYRRVADCFVVPTERGPWRADLALGSGLTAIAVEAALRDVALWRGAEAGRVVADPTLLAAITLDPTSGRVLACSYSTRSSEVVDGIARLRSRGIPCDLHGAGPDADLPLSATWVDRPVRHAAFCATIPALLGAPFAARPADAAAAAAFLGKQDADGLVPLFVSQRHGFRARVLLSYWLEYMQRPGFGLIYPDFTHDFLWVGARRRMAGYAFVLEPPTEELSDHRFRSVCALLRATGTPHLVLDAEPMLQPGDHIGYVLAAADEVLAVAESRGRDLQTELTFASWQGADAHE
jgi:hypothetical protein